MPVQNNINQQKTRILLFHNALVGYTRPFFQRLSEVDDVRFVFTDMRLSKDVYGVAEAKQLEGFDRKKYRVLKHYFGIAFGVIGEMLKGGYDVVVDSLGSKESVMTFFLAKILRKPIVLWSNEWGWKGKSDERRPFASLIRFMASHADAMIGPGTKHREYFISLGTSPGKAFIMPGALNVLISEEDFRKKEELKLKLNTGGKKVVLFVGRLIKRKGVEYLMEAFSRLKKEKDDITLVLAGRGELQAQLEQLAASLDLKDDTRFVGYVDEKDLLPYYLLCDICIVPSTTHGMGDPWVWVVNEAMSAGKPVIASDAVGAAYDLIKDGVNGFMVPERDSDALFKALKTIISNPQLAREMGEASKRIIEKGFTVDYMVSGFNKAIDSISSGQK